MNVFARSAWLFFRKPITMIIFSLGILLYCLVQHNLITPMLRVVSIKELNVFIGIIYVFTLVFNLVERMSTQFTLLIKLLAGILGISFIASLMLSGYLYVLQKVATRVKLKTWDFFEGLKRYFIRIFMICIKVIIITVVYKTIIAISILPASVLSGMAFGGNKQLMYPAIFVSVISIVVVFLSYIFYTSYISVWYTSAIAYKDKYLYHAKKIVDKSFGAIVKNILKCGLLLLILEAIVVASDIQLHISYSDNVIYQHLLVFANWFLVTWIVTAYILRVMVITSSKSAEQS